MAPTVCLSCMLMLLMSITVLQYVMVNGEATKPKHKVLIVSMDGFRYDYMNKTNTPNFDKMVREGVTMPYMKNQFVTNTFPNHYTMATGLYSESHGIVFNHMYDPVFDSTFSPSVTETRWWDAGEPFWTTAVKAGLTAGVYFWVGSQAEIQGIRPTFWKPYVKSTPFESRVKTTVTWLVEDDVDLGVLYFDEPDTSGHNFGPDSPQMKPVIRRMDTIAGLIFDELEKAGIVDHINVIITSDHGMASVNLNTSTIDLNAYVNSSVLRNVVEQGSTASLWAQPGQAAALRDALAEVPHMQVWLREDIPEEFHMKNNRRVPDVFAVADLGWTITDDLAGRIAWGYKGDHGYDKDLDIMKPFFLARGPDFKTNHVVQPIENVDLYPLVCHLLGIQPAPNNGSLERAATLIVTDSMGSDTVAKLDSGVGIVVLTFTAVLMNSGVV